MRYYSSKEELFAAAASIDFHMPDLQGVPPANRGVALVTHILDSWEGTESDELQAILRAAGTYELARQRLAEIVEKQAVPVIKSVLPANRLEERLGLIVIQITGLVLARYFFRHASVAALNREVIIARLGAAIQVHMTNEG